MGRKIRWREVEDREREEEKSVEISSELEAEREKRAPVTKKGRRKSNKKDCRKPGCMCVCGVVTNLRTDHLRE